MATLTNIDKSPTTITGTDKSPATIGNSDKSPASATNSVKDKEISFLLREALGYLLLESGGKIILTDHDFLNVTKSPASLTNISKS